MKRKNLLYLFAATLILAPLTWWIIEVNYSSGYLELYDVKDGRDGWGSLCKISYLRWHGKNGTLLNFVSINGVVHAIDKWNQTVNDGDVFSVSVPIVCSHVEIYYDHKKVTVTGDGKLTESVSILKQP